MRKKKREKRDFGGEDWILCVDGEEEGVGLGWESFLVGAIDLFSFEWLTCSPTIR